MIEKALDQKFATKIVVLRGTCPWRGAGGEVAGGMGGRGRGLLERADIVLYPVDCISHEAALHLKAHCKRSDKPFIPLRNSSISEFRRAIKSWCGLG